MSAEAAVQPGQDGAPPSPVGDGEAPVLFTQAAVEHILKLMKRENLDPAAAGLRVAVIGGGCSGLSYKLAFEKEPRRRDKVYELSGGVRVFMDPKSALYLKGTQLDFVDTLDGTGFTFSNPNAAGSCGCGQSFSV